MTGAVTNVITSSADDLVAGATLREPLLHGDSKSGAVFERVVMDGQALVLKHLRLADDWIMRVTGDVVCRPVQLVRAGLLDRLPASIETGIVGAAWDARRREGAVLMRDLGPWIVPEGEDPLPLEMHLRFIEHMAELHATFWGWTDTIGLTPLASRYLEFTPHVEEVERALGSAHPVPPLIGEGWRRFPERSPAAAAVVLPLLDDPGPLLDALETTPQTLLHGDWKAGNLGAMPDGRTILLDWALPGAGPACSDLAWYVALNRQRLPQPKEAVIAAYRTALERHGIELRGWWDRQLSLALLAAVVQLGWEKALGDDDELRWWEQRVLEGARWLP